MEPLKILKKQINFGFIICDRKQIFINALKILEYAIRYAQRKPFEIKKKTIK